jgi:hypothetical protein
MISSVYNNENNIPINKQAVKEFFTDHELHNDPPELAVKPPPEIKIEYFKKAPADMTLAVSIDSDISVLDYERVAVALRKMQQNRPRKLSKLIRFIQYANNCKKQYALLIINHMSQQCFIKIIGDDVVYF